MPSIRALSSPPSLPWWCPAGATSWAALVNFFSDQVDVATEGYDAIVPTMLSNLPELLIAIVVILVLSASMSTLSALVMTSSSTITLDLLKGNMVKKMNDFQAVFIIRCFIVVFIIISMVIAIIQYKYSISFIAQLMGVSWGALARRFSWPPSFIPSTGKRPPRPLAGPPSSLAPA